MAQGATAERRSKARIISRSGRYRSAVPVRPGETGFDIALDATLRRAAQRLAGEHGTRPAITPADLCKKQRERPCNNLIVFAVDSSDSMGADAAARMRAAKGAVLALLRKAYQGRHEVALVTFGGEQARVVLPPTSSINRAQHCLEQLPTGGATPMADGLFQSWQLIRLQRHKQPGIKPILVLISDGEANVPLADGAPIMQELFHLADRIRQDKIIAVVLDAAALRPNPTEMRLLARRMNAAYVPLSELKVRHILRAVRQVEALQQSDKVVSF
jgi:magnesium chelatase subunit D